MRFPNGFQRRVQRRLTYCQNYVTSMSNGGIILDHPDIPPDNNLAERSLRLAVTKRNVSGGSRSFERFQDTACLLSVVQTCRTQQRSVINFFADALRKSVGYQTTIASLIPIF